jgi:transglutaminase-like putative cysteine protease
MTHVRWRLALLALAATIFALYPITSLFTSDDWFGQAVATAALVAALGVLMRALVHSRVVTLLVQVVVTTYALLLHFSGETFAYLLPTTETLDQANSLGLVALETIQKHSAPAPLNDGVTFCLVVAAALVAIAVDATAATWQSPAAAGLPLLTAYLITAANGTEALRATYFVVPVLLWLAMLHVSARSRFGRWSTTSASEEKEAGEPDEAGQDRRALWALSAGAARFGLLGVVLAMIIPVMVPHFPPRYLTDGLGRSSEAGAAGTVGFSDTVDLTRSLQSTDQSPVLRYGTTGFGRIPLRVLATSYFSGGQWRPEGRSRAGTELAPLPARENRTDYVMSVSSNVLEPPALAAPYPVVAISVEGVGWTVDPLTGDVKVNGRAADYQVTYTDLAPTAAELRDAGEPSARSVRDEDLALPDSSRALVTAWAREVTAGRTTSLDKAIAIQEHLRDTSRYTYNLDLGPPLRDTAGRVVEPVRTFYETRRGYCVQFATAMILMARAEGIPARMAIGFLPGSRTGSEYIVRASDAHAWPELYFEGYGWIRFEPTPAQRSGGRPAYTVEGTGDTTGGGQAVDGEEPTSTATTPFRRQDLEGADSGTTGSPATWFGDLLTTRDVVTITAVLIGLLATFLMPLTAWVVRLRRRRAASNRQELIEADWEELTAHLRDLGLSPPQGGTLRQWRQHFVTTGHLDADNTKAIGRVTATLERARYDRPDRTTPEEAALVHRDIKAVRRHISRTRAWQTRVRSYLWPSTGVEVWRRLPRLLRRRSEHTTPPVE